MQKVLVIRLSAMGDVVLTVPVIKAILSANDHVEVVLLTRSLFAPFFYGINRLQLVHPNLQKEHKGFLGLFRLISELKKTYQFDAIIDLHDVLRTKIIRKAFEIRGIPSFTIDKGRKEKKKFIQGKISKELIHTTDRYKKVFIDAGFTKFEPNSKMIECNSIDKAFVSSFLTNSSIQDSDILIGIAPFAKHQAKIWGIEKISEFIHILLKKKSVKIFLFGGGEQELKQLKTLEKNLRVFSAAGQFTLGQEIALISQMNCFLSMDSSNMHIASLCGIETFSIWGGTHPFLGFKALWQDPENSIEIPKEELSCRPCSVYGKKECTRTDVKYKCMKDISAKMVYQKIASKIPLN